MATQNERCRRIRHFWLSVFLLLLVMSTTAVLLGLLTPSWQVVYLEDGRTEHHHGLWLDCKRDFSYDYGRPREYYETLHRRFDLAGPFDQFWLPPLLCVFKFDYWLDDEDWYEFGYDENRLWGDAYQHLFLGWKIAALVAHLVVAICSLCSILFTVCAYFHRLCTCVAAVLVTLAVLAGLGGNAVFYAFASDQNTNIIKEEDGIYEQHFGWSFWMSLVGNCLLLFASLTGCVTTKIVLGKKRTKLIKIQADDFGDDSTQLLRLSAASSAYAPPHQTADSSAAVFRPVQQQQQRKKQFQRNPSGGHRSSTIYKIESNELKQWERERMRTVEKEMGHQQFKRTNSMPMIRRQQSAQDQQLLHNALSISDLSRPAFVVGDPSHEPPRFRSMANGPPFRQMPCDASAAPSGDVIYEYVDQGSVSLASTLKAGDFVRSKSRLNVYDPVPLMNSGRRQTAALAQQRIQQSTSIGCIQSIDQQRRGDIYGENEYLQPKSLTGSGSGGDNNSAASSTMGRQMPLIMPVDANAVREGPPVVPTTVATSSSSSTSSLSSTTAFNDAKVPPQIPLNTFPHQKQQRIWEAQILAELKQRREQQHQHENSFGIHSRTAASPRRLCPPILSDVTASPLISVTLAQQPPIDSIRPTVSTQNTGYSIQINTFQQMAHGKQQQQEQQKQQHQTPPANTISIDRPITDLVSLGHNGTALPVRVFERGQTDSSERSPNSTTLSSSVHSENCPPTFLGTEMPPPMGSTLLRERLGSPILTHRGSDWRRDTVQSETDRSLGSSRTATTFLGSPPDDGRPIEQRGQQPVARANGQRGTVVDAGDNFGQSVHGGVTFDRRMFFGQNGTSPGTDV